MIRPAGPGDAGAIAAIYRGHVLDGVATFETDPPDGSAMAARMAAHPTHPWLVVEAEGAVAGYAHAAPFHPRAAYRWAAETSIYVADGAQGRGLGHRLYAALLAELEILGFTQAIARIALPHPASVALHEALGFVAVGVTRGVGYKLGRWVDVGLWQRALAMPDDPPREPGPNRSC